ncbi:RHS repeat-associated core domain-containing protein, partial [Dokdonella fugitiva]
QGGATETTHYLVDPNLAFAQVVAEYGDDGHASAVYVYGDELLLRIEPEQSNKATAYHHDGLGSVVALTDDTGIALQTYGYDAWGNRVETIGADVSPYGFAGERSDADTGLIYLRARWYDPQVGRFTSSDSASGLRTVPLSLNKYLYANANPTGAVDPFGTMTLGDVGASIDIQGILSGIARDQISSFVQDIIFGDDENTDQPSLWDAVINSMLGGQYGLANLMSSLTPSIATSGLGSLGTSGGPKHQHHTIPVYLCGRDAQPKALIPAADHYVIHGVLDRVPLAINTAGRIVSILLNRRKAKSFQPILSKWLRKSSNRAILAGALDVFYVSGGFSGLPNANVPGTTLQDVLLAEAPLFISSRRFTSLDACKK